MTPRDLNRLLHAASVSADPPDVEDRVETVWRGIARGWDPERIEWQRWLRRWWPWAALTVGVVTLVVSEWPHGRHPDATHPPALSLFQEAAGTPGRTTRP
jgi:hypothetical protein